MNIQSDQILAPFTTWNIGGVADYFAQPKDKTELLNAVHWAKEKSIDITILGRGSNVLISDRGIRGLTLCLRDFGSSLRPENVSPDNNGLIEIEAGVSLPRLSKIAASLGWLGYGFLVGIPGTVGGGLYMNAGYKRGENEEMAQLCTEVSYLNDKLQIKTKPYTSCRPSYRYTDFQNSGDIILSGKFRNIGSGDPQTIRKDVSKHLQMRKEMQPLKEKTAGSIFKGTEDGTPAAVYIDKAGLKNFQVGGARVSPKHTNWIENTGNATASDVLKLINEIKNVVKNKYKIELISEIQKLGEF